MSGGYNLLVVILAVGNILAMLWLLWWTRKRRVEGKPGEATTGHVWDEDLREYNNPLPRWWLFVFLISIAFSAAYLAMYPGLGNYQGTLQWTSARQHQAQQQAVEAEAQRVLAPFNNLSVDQLRKNPAALAVGRNLFASNCILCHGSDAQGAPGFPNLTDKDWLWGGDPDTVVATITGGRTGIMIGWRDVLGGDAGVNDVLAYVLSLSGRSAREAGNAAHGKELFDANCIACHGADGKGNQALGAPNLTDNIWLHGSSVSTIRDVIANGRQGQMPAQGGRQSELKVRLLAAYVLSLGDGS
jgi:cytochrome c oxidase cbb3-type subunit III